MPNRRIPGTGSFNLLDALRLQYRFVAATGNVLATDTIIAVDTTAAVTLTLEAAATAGVGRVIFVCDGLSNATAQNITLNPQAAEQIDLGGAGVGVTIAADDGQVAVVSDGTQWFTII